jgi:hypothetical protein
LSRQHGSIGGGFVAVGFHFHAAGDSADGFASTVRSHLVSLCTSLGGQSALAEDSRDKPEIGDMDEGVVEGCEDTGDAEDEFTCMPLSIGVVFARKRADTDLLGLEDQGRCFPWPRARPSSWEACW